MMATRKVKVWGDCDFEDCPHIVGVDDPKIIAGKCSYHWEKCYIDEQREVDNG